MRISISYIKFRFAVPTILDKNKYVFFKDLLQKNPDYRLKPPTDFFRYFKIHLFVFGTTIVTGLLTPIAEVFEAICAISLLLSVYLLISFFLSLPHYLKYCKEKNYYYSNLKEKILNTKDYDAFVEYMKLYEKYSVLDIDDSND